MMHKITTPLLRAVILLVLAPLAQASQAILLTAATKVDVAFSPRGGITAMMVKQIQQAQHSIYIAAYSFTSAPIAKALVQAFQRGVDVKVVMDRSQQRARYTAATFLSHYHIPVRINARYKILHDKYMVIDQKTVELGSFNFTKAAELSNAENAIIIENNPGIANQYLKDWQRLWNEAKEYRQSEGEILVQKKKRPYGAY